jgi:hypothetical protein
MCIVTKTTALAAIAWAAPLAFELLVLGALVWNALDRPRATSTTISRTIRNDGAMYYAAVAALRAIQTGLMATGKPRYFMLTNTFVISGLLSAQFN